VRAKAVPSTSILLAFGFGNLAMLGWLAAAAAPLLIHLWSRRRYREVPWAAVAFLLAAVRKNSRRIQLQQWLLLAVRTLLIVLVVLAVAEPYAEQIGGAGSSVPTHRILVVDTSFSMACRDVESSRLERAKQWAEDLVEHSGPADALTIVTLADVPRRHDRLDAVAQSHGRANLAATLDLVAAALRPDVDSPRRFDRQEVYFFTDLQRETWDKGATDRLLQLAEQASLIAVDCGTPRAANLAVTDLRVAEPFVTVDREIPFAVTLHEFGGELRRSVAVEFLVDGQPVGQQSVDVPAGGDAAARFSHRFRVVGNHTLAVRAAGDRLEVDNTRWLAVPVVERVNVLCVGGDVADAAYVADALDPDPSDQSPHHPRIVTEGELADVDLAPFSGVFLCNVAQLTADEAERLARYVRQGGGLAIFLGDRVVAESYNALAGNGRELLPARLGEIVNGPQAGVDPLEYRHPIAAPFRGRERAGLLTTPVRRYCRLEPPTDGKQEVVARLLPSGDPLIVAAALGRGRVVLVATAGSLASSDPESGEPWTAWPAWPSFLPVIREILAYAAAGQQGAWQTTVGSPLVLPTSLDAGNGALEVTRPDGRKTSALADTDLSGIYTVRRPGSDFVAQFAVNVDTRESDLAQVEPGELPSELLVRAQAHSTASGGAGAEGLAPRAAWQRSLLWTALGLLFVELCLAWTFGRGAR
jgi:hypothetical protein